MTKQTSQQYSIEHFLESRRYIPTIPDLRPSSELNFHRPQANNNYGTSNFPFVSSKLWETIPTNIKILPYTSFFNQYKLYLLTLNLLYNLYISLYMFCHRSMRLLFIYKDFFSIVT